MLILIIIKDFIKFPIFQKNNILQVLFISNIFVVFKKSFKYYYTIFLN